MAPPHPRSPLCLHPGNGHRLLCRPGRGWTWWCPRDGALAGARISTGHGPVAPGALLLLGRSRPPCAFVHPLLGTQGPRDTPSSWVCSLVPFPFPEVPPMPLEVSSAGSRSCLGEGPARPRQSLRAWRRARSLAPHPPVLRKLPSWVSSAGRTVSGLAGIRGGCGGREAWR